MIDDLAALRARVAELTTKLALSDDAALGQNRRAVAAEARVAELEAALRFIRPAVPVLRDILRRAGLRQGIAKADEMIAEIDRTLGEEAGRG